MRKPDGQSLFLGAVIVGVMVFGAYLFISKSNGQPRRPATLTFNGSRAYQHLQRICEIGSRVSGTEGMLKQQKMLSEHFTRCGAKVTFQTWQHRNPQTGQPINLSNMIVEFHPDRRDRILLCAHYDTRPFPDEDPDPRKRRSLFVGANDGASGVAVLCELGTMLPELRSHYGVDVVLFDAEELIYDKNRDKFFLGSQYFADVYRAERNQPNMPRYHWGVLLDMVGDKELQIFQEGNSVKYARKLVADVWDAAERLGVSEFKPRQRHTVSDDHLPLNETARIPTIDVIDFDYPRSGRVNYWHTTQDVPANCSADSLTKVGSVIHEWLKTVDQTLPVPK